MVCLRMSSFIELNRDSGGGVGLPAGYQRLGSRTTTSAPLSRPYHP